MNLMAQGKHREAEPHWKQAARSYEAVRLLLTSAALDRAMIGAEYSPLPGMAVCLAANGRPAEAWQALELNLARGLLDEARSRRGQELTPVQLASQQKLKQQVNELRPRILSLLVKKDSTDADQKQLQDLLGLRSQAEDQLGLLASEISQQEALGLKQIQKHLPSDAALVVWLDVRKRSGVVSEHWSCVVRATGAPIWVRLSGSGPNGAWSEADLELVERLRRTLLIAKTGPATNGGGDASVAGLAELRARLRQLRLDPLRPHLQGVRRLFVVPIGAMTHIPLEAITDEFTVSYVPSGTQLVKLQQRRPEAGALAESLRAERSLMALADPNFGTQASNPGEGAALRSALWKPLPGSAHEVQAISSLFAKPTVLTKSAASEQKLEALRLSGELAQFKVLHIATHGLAHQTRSFESALILSQDALPDGVQRQLQGKKPIDGRLTAREVLDDWKLNAELVVLSACESALGRQGGGEGLLGFSQAFLLAGSRSVILSLWQVDDAATALLMTRFYENWLGQGRDATGASRPHIPKAEALREAKQWLRNLTREEAEKRIAGLPETARGLKLVPKADSRQPIAGSDKPFEHPFYWSAFVLIGDPN
jgi:CHAT domain-containing protein